MAEITAAQVKALREATNVSMMECKRALVEADGDMDNATKLLRERGMAVAAKKASRAANQGLIISASSADGSIKSLAEVNCETDFVARNADFQTFAASIAEKAIATDANLADELKDELVAKVAEIGENLILRRNIRFELGGNGIVESYIHLGGKVGVLVELACGKADTAQQASFKELARDMTLHVAACSPAFLTSDEVPADVVASERAIYAAQVKDKPAQIIDKIVDGKMQKFFAESCLISQGFVKEPKQSVTQLLEEKGKELGDTITIKRFVRYQLGA